MRIVGSFSSENKEYELSAVTEKHKAIFERIHQQIVTEQYLVLSELRDSSPSAY